MYAWFGAHAGKFFMEMASRCQRRRLVITADNCAGLVPEIARPGDLIAVFDGCAVLFVLRADLRRRYQSEELTLI